MEVPECRVQRSVAQKFLDRKDINSQVVEHHAGGCVTKPMKLERREKVRGETMKMRRELNRMAMLEALPNGVS